MNPSTFNLEALGVSGIAVAILLCWVFMERQNKKDLRKDLRGEREYNRQRDDRELDAKQKIIVSSEKLTTALTLLKEALK